MKVIFLDHYGVMTLSKIPIKRTYGSLPSVQEFKHCRPFDSFDKEAVEVLNSILKETDAEIVISSDWKNNSTINEMKEFYLLQGVIKSPISFTLKSPYKTNIHKQRSIEILDWIESNSDITHWVCIDDLSLDLKNFVWCKFPYKGIKQSGIKEKILSYLS